MRVIPVSSRFRCYRRLRQQAGLNTLHTASQLWISKLGAQANSSGFEKQRLHMVGHVFLDNVSRKRMKSYVKLIRLCFIFCSPSLTLDSVGLSSWTSGDEISCITQPSNHRNYTTDSSHGYQPYCSLDIVSVFSCYSFTRSWGRYWASFNRPFFAKTRELSGRQVWIITAEAFPKSSTPVS